MAQTSQAHNQFLKNLKNKVEKQKVTQQAEMKEQLEPLMSDYKNQLNSMMNTMLKNTERQFQQWLKENKELDKTKTQISLVSAEIERLSKQIDLTEYLQEKTKAIQKLIFLAIIAIITLIVGTTAIILLANLAYKTLAELNPLWFLVPLIIVLIPIIVWIVKPYEPKENQ